MSTSAAFGDQLDALGIWWPRGDGDALRELAAIWTATAELVDDVAVVLDAAAVSVADNHHGEAGTAFSELWQHWSGPNGHLPVTSADCRTLAASLEDFATDIDVADRQIVHFFEQATSVLESGVPVTAETNAAWVAWMHDCSTVVRGELERHATQHACLLGELGSGPAPMVPDAMANAGSGRTDRVELVDPRSVSWVGPGTPKDLSSLLTDPVDFGSGQGEPRSPFLPPAPIGRPGPGIGETTPVPPDVGDGAGGVAMGAGGAGATTINVYGDGNTVNVTPFAPGGGAPIGGSGDRPPDFVPGVVDGLPADDSGPFAADRLGGGGSGIDVGGGGDGSGGGFGGGGLGGGGGFGGIPSSGSFGGDLGIAPPTDFVPPVGTGLDVGFDPATAGASTIPPTIPIDVSRPAASVATAAAAGSTSGRTPMMPFMPMGGGGGGGAGDDGNEPRRRRTFNR